MKIFKAYVYAINQLTGDLERFDWKPVMADNRDAATILCRKQFPFVVVGEEQEGASFEQSVLNCYKKC